MVRKSKARFLPFLARRLISCGMGNRLPDLSYPRLYPVFYGLNEETVNSVTHGLGVLVSIAGLVMLLFRGARSNSLWMLTGFSIYGASLILLFLSSTLYHALPYPRVKSVLRSIDHSSIYILIAGTYTPFTLISIRGNWGWALFGTIWGLALGGILFTGFFRDQFPRIGILTYVLMGRTLFLEKD